MDKKVSDLTEVINLVDDALFYVVDTADLSEDVAGTSKKIKKSSLIKKASILHSGTVKTDITEADPVVYTKTTMDSLLGAKADLVGGKVPASQLPSYVDDVVEVANFGALPITGESGKIYVTIDNNKQYRWTGTVYVEFTAGVSDHTLLTNIGTNTHPQIDAHIANTSNPHNVTKAQIGLGNVDNTSDADKPVSTAQNIAINEKVEDAIVDGVTTIAPSQNAVFDALILKSNDADVIHTTGDEFKDGSLYIQDINNTGNAIIGDASNNTAGVGVLGSAYSALTVGQSPYGIGVLGIGNGTAVGLKGYSQNGIGGWFTGKVKIATFCELTGTGPFVETERVYILASGLLKSNSIIINQTTDNTVDKLQVNGSTLSTAFKKTGDTNANILLAGGGVTALSGLATTTNLATKENTITAGTIAQYWRGDKTFQNLDKTVVGLPNVDNTSDLLKPISTATQTALDLKSNQDGTILYHNTKWFTPIGTVSNVGATVTSVGTQFTIAMVGAKLIINGEQRIITAFTSSTVVTVNTAYSVNNTGIVAGSWGVYSKAYTNLQADNPNLAGGFMMFNHQGNNLIRAHFDRIEMGLRIADGLNNVAFNAISNNAFQLGGDKNIQWFPISANNALNGVPDLGLRRNIAGVLEIYDGLTAGGSLTNRRDLLVRNVLASEVLVGTIVDNGVDLIQVNGTISASPATLSNQVVIKSQLDAKFSGSIIPLNEGNGIGYVIEGRNPANYGNIGLGAVDLTFSVNASGARGATGRLAFAVGENNTANAEYSFAEGANNLASASGAHAEGFSNISSGVYSHTEGATNIASGYAAHAGGLHNFARARSQTSIGVYGTDYIPAAGGGVSSETDRIFNVGNGSFGALSDAFTILKNGNVGIGTNTPGYPLAVSNNKVLGNTAGDTQPIAEFANNQQNAVFLRLISRKHTTGTDWNRSNLRLQKTVDVSPMGFIDFGIDGVFSDYGLGFGSGSTTQMVLRVGNVGIGTTAPTSRLQVVGLPSYADNASAITGGLTVGAFYHTAGVLKVVI